MDPRSIDDINNIDDIATRFFAAIEADDLESVASIYAADVRVWHNVTQREQTREENLELLAAFAARVSNRRYEILARDVFKMGFVQRHVLHGDLADGRAIAIQVAIVIYVRNGCIERLYEYLDSEAIAPVFAAGSNRQTS